MSEARVSAYAAMHRKEVVRLSKDSMNQLDQTSIPRQNTSASPRSVTPEILPEALPQIAHASSNNNNNNNNKNGTTGNGAAAPQTSQSPPSFRSDDVSSKHGGYDSVDEMKRNGLSIGTSRDVDAVFRDRALDSNGRNLDNGACYLHRTAAVSLQCYCVIFDYAKP